VREGDGVEEEEEEVGREREREREREKEREKENLYWHASILASFLLFPLIPSEPPGWY
jgi:hypothetical protein